MIQPTHDLHGCVFTAETDGRKETNENMSEHKGEADEGTQNMTPTPGAGAEEGLKFKEGTSLCRYEAITADVNNNINVNTQSFQW